MHAHAQMQHLIRLFGRQTEIGMADPVFYFLRFIIELSDGARRCTMALWSTEQHIIYGLMWPVSLFQFHSSPSFCLVSLGIGWFLSFRHESSILNSTSTKSTNVPSHLLTCLMSESCCATHRFGPWKCDNAPWECANAPCILCQNALFHLSTLVTCFSLSYAQKRDHNTHVSCA